MKISIAAILGSCGNSCSTYFCIYLTERLVLDHILLVRTYDREWERKKKSVFVQDGLMMFSSSMRVIERESKAMQRIARRLDLLSSRLAAAHRPNPIKNRFSSCRLGHQSQDPICHAILSIKWPFSAHSKQSNELSAGFTFTPTYYIEMYHFISWEKTN